MFNQKLGFFIVGIEKDTYVGIRRRNYTRLNWTPEHNARKCGKRLLPAAKVETFAFRKLRLAIDHSQLPDHHYGRSDHLKNDDIAWKQPVKSSNLRSTRPISGLLTWRRGSEWEEYIVWVALETSAFSQGSEENRRWCSQKTVGVFAVYSFDGCELLFWRLLGCSVEIKEWWFDQFIYFIQKQQQLYMETVPWFHSPPFDVI